MTRDVDIRAAGVMDAGQIGAILSEWIDETNWMPRIHTRAEDVAHAETLVERGWVRVAISDGVVAGFLARNQTLVHALYVRSDDRRVGVGTCLLQDAMIHEKMLELWTFEQNLPARAFYQRHGFQEVTRTDGSGNDEGLPDILFRWERTKQ